jgi:hypothetical protein
MKNNVKCIGFCKDLFLSYFDLLSKKTVFQQFLFLRIKFCYYIAIVENYFIIIHKN